MQMALEAAIDPCKNAGSNAADERWPVIFASASDQQQLL
jgi:hypothetical protein